MELTEQKFEQILDKKLASFANKYDFEGFATKDDLKAFATKDDLKAFATKDDLYTVEQRMGQKFATKDDLHDLEKRMGQKFASKNDLILLEDRMKDFSREQTSELGAMMAETVAIPLREHIERCEKVRA